MFFLFRCMKTDLSLDFFFFNLQASPTVLLLHLPFLERAPAGYSPQLLSPLWQRQAPGLRNTAAARAGGVPPLAVGSQQYRLKTEEPAKSTEYTRALGKTHQKCTLPAT